MSEGPCSVQKLFSLHSSVSLWTFLMFPCWLLFQSGLFRFFMNLQPAVNISSSWYSLKSKSILAISNKSLAFIAVQDFTKSSQTSYINIHYSVSGKTFFEKKRIQPPSPNNPTPILPPPKWQLQHLLLLLLPPSLIFFWRWSRKSWLERTRDWLPNVV